MLSNLTEQLKLKLNEIKIIITWKLFKLLLYGNGGCFEYKRQFKKKTLNLNLNGKLKRHKQSVDDSINKKVF